MNSNNKPWYEKIGILVAIIAGICTILTFVFNLSLNENSDSIEIEDNDNKVDNSVNVEGDGNIIIYENPNSNINIDMSPNSIQSPETELLENDTTLQFDFSSAMKDIFKNEQRINKQKGKPIYSSLYSGINFYYITGTDEICLIEVAKGFRDIDCSRIYYFNENGELSFSLMQDSEGEHRLYFYDDILIRYKNINGKDYDINYGLETCECKWTELALTESYEIFNAVSKTSEPDAFTIVASHQTNPIQISDNGIDILITAITSFEADHVTISSLSDDGKEVLFNMHGNSNNWWFNANFYIKGTYTVTITAYNFDGESVSDTFIYTY